MKFVIGFMIIWLGLGLLGFGARNAAYQINQPGSQWSDWACWSKGYQFRHIRDELFNAIPIVLGPIYFIYSFIDTGAFHSGFSFYIGTPKRCIK